MEVLKIDRIEKVISGELQITGSKSETNRLLILKQFYPNLEIKNASNSDDSRLLKKALKSKDQEINIGHAGTAMRFLTAYYSGKMNSEIVLTGSSRMKERPIKILVDALRSLGANIEYLGEEGFPPLKIKGANLSGREVEINGSISSQYITALLLLAPSLKNGLTLKFKGTVTSVPYIQMTLELLGKLGIEYTWNGPRIEVQPKMKILNQEVVVESDWSSASYFYSLVALNKDARLTLSSYFQNSLQGDAVLASLFEPLGVRTTYGENNISLEWFSTEKLKQPVEINLINAPDIAQTIVVTCFGKGISCFLTGLHTLKIKETDRLVALKNEIEKMGGSVTITENTLLLEASNKIQQNCSISTYNDHRMALAFSALASRVSLGIEHPGVVSKSYPSYWEDFNRICQ